jgi:hypothetical protein
MKKWFLIIVGFIFVLSWSGFSLAAEEKATPEKAAEAAKPSGEVKTSEEAKPAEAAKTEEAKKEAPKPVIVKYRMGGEVVEVDAAARKITLKQDAVKKQKKVTLKVGKKATMDLEGVNAGDVVNVWVEGKTITKLTKVY